MHYASDFRRMAREALSGRWMLAVGTGFVATLLGASIMGMGGGGSSNGSGNGGDKESYLHNILDPELLSIIKPILIGLGTVAIIYFIIRLVIGGATTLGYAKFNLNLVDNVEARFDDIFSQYNRLGAGFLMQLLRGIYTALWTLLFIIPGVIAAYSYSMTPYIMYENPDVGANDAIGMSKEMMKGNKWRLFCLQFSFIGWAFLCIFTVGIGFLWLKPYIEASSAAFYREVSQEYRRYDEN